MSNPIDPLATSPAVVPTDPTNKYCAPHGPYHDSYESLTPSCFACGGYHSSVNQATLCLQLTLRATRRRVGDLEATLRDVDYQLREIYWCHVITARTAIAKALDNDAGPVLVDTVSK
jgi:hypothetical protein